MPSLAASAIKAFSRMTIKRRGLSREQLIKHLKRSFDHSPTLVLLPKGVTIRPLSAPPFEGEVVSVANPKMAILYFHGGAFIAGVTRTYHNFASRLAAELQAEVYLARYPFAPENPYPAATDRALEAYRYLLDQGKNPRDIAIAGDSAGGCLTLTTLLKARDAGLPMPRCAVAMSPAASCLADGPSIKANDDKDAMLSADIIRVATQIYAPDSARHREPYCSPAFGDYRGVPPVMITVDKTECLYSDAEAVRKQLELAGVPCNWYERNGLFHVWPIMVPFLPESKEALADIASFIRQHG
jgi:acetyl esterase/lipase